MRDSEIGYWNYFQRLCHFAVKC